MSNTSRADTKLKKDSKKKKEEVGKLSPTHSEIEEPITFKPIDGEEVQALAIKENDLKNTAKPKSNPTNKLSDILVKKRNKNAYPTKEIKVAKLVVDKPLKQVELNDHLGIHFDANGNYLAHSILGSLDEYLEQAAENGKPIGIPSFSQTNTSDVPKADLYLNSENNTDNLPDNGSNALNHWRKKMIERKHVQKSISKSINRQVDDLVMNQSDSSRRFNEIKTLLDRTLPLVEHGKGYRYGSEFWNQPFQIGSSDNGLFTTLTNSEQGNIPEFEQILKPLVTIKETDFKENQPPVTHYPWDRSEYLQKRLVDLEPLIKEIIPHRPEFAELQVIGKQLEEKSTETNSSQTNKDFLVNDTWINPKIYGKDDSNKNTDSETNDFNKHYLIDTADDPFQEHPDIVQTPVFGPCVVFGGQTAKWTGNEMNNKGVIALESRLNFETKAAKRVLATFEIFNIGTTAIYYDWKKTVEYNPFDISNSQVQRFYFDTRSNVILPGECFKLHVVFKSSKGGIFTEKWEFITQPALISGASLVLTLRGVAIQEDKHKKNRALIEKQLLNKEAEIMANQMIDLILSGVRTPERCQSPQNTYLTEEDLFNQINPDLHYDHDTISELKGLCNELQETETSETPKTEWDLSINTLKLNIMKLDELDPNKQDFLARLNTLINNLCFSKYSPNYSKMYSICYNLFCHNLDSISNELYNIKQNLNIINDSNDDYPIIDEFNNRYEHWNKENELFKQNELEKKNRLENLKGKESKDKGGGKMTAGGKKDAKKDEKKKSTPTPSAKNVRQPPAKEVASRSASRNNPDKIDERSRTPKTNNNSVLTDEEFKTKNVFEDKAYINVYQILCKMVDNMENIFDDMMQSTDIEERLSTIVFQPSNTKIDMNSDYID